MNLLSIVKKKSLQQFLIDQLTFNAEQFYILQRTILSVVTVAHKLEISPNVCLVVHIKLSYDPCRFILIREGVIEHTCPWSTRVIREHPGKTFHTPVKVPCLATSCCYKF